VHLQAPTPPSARVTAVVQAGEIDRFLKLLPGIAPVTVLRRGGEVWLVPE
jgi:ferric-dicitrate binding protein FerR (iron transport regulator)